MPRIHYPSQPHEYRGWRYDPIIDEDGDRFDYVMHCAARDDLPPRYMGSIGIRGSSYHLLDAEAFAAEIDRIEAEGLPPPPPRLGERWAKEIDLVGIFTEMFRQPIEGRV